MMLACRKQTIYRWPACGRQMTELTASSGLAGDQALQPLKRLDHVLPGPRGGHVAQDEAECLMGDVPRFPHARAAIDRLELITPDAARQPGPSPAGRLGGPRDPPPLVELGDGADH